MKRFNINNPIVSMSLILVLCVIFLSYQSINTPYLIQGFTGMDASLNAIAPKLIISSDTLNKGGSVNFTILFNGPKGNLPVTLKKSTSKPLFSDLFDTPIPFNCSVSLVIASDTQIKYKMQYKNGYPKTTSSAVTTYYKVKANAFKIIDTPLNVTSNSVALKWYK